MPQWATFAGITGVVLVLLLVLTHLTQSAFTDGTASRSDVETPSPAHDEPTSQPDPGIDSQADERDTQTTPESGSPADATTETPESPTDRATPIDRDSSPPTGESPERSDDRVGSRSPDEPGSVADGATRDIQRSSDSHPDEFDPDRPQMRDGQRDQLDPESLSTGMVLANVAASQGLFALVLIGAVIYTGIPAGALGVEFSWSYLETGLLWGTAFGIVLYIANEVGAATATWFGFDHDEGLRELLAPETAQGWLILLVGVLPIIAVFEELLFRAALIGAISAGFGVNPWLLAIGSSIAFALGHGIQGTVGIVVTGVLGFVLAAGFILTGSFLVVVVAHYWINALEFAVHEGLGFDWAETLER